MSRNWYSIRKKPHIEQVDQSIQLTLVVEGQSPQAMGMFDYVHIELARLPVSADDQERLRKEAFQTKSVEQMLSDVFITDDGYLERLINEIVLDQESPDYEPPKRVRFSDAHGVLFFYTSVDDGEWFEFMATFTDGQLTNLKRVETQRVSRDATVYWSEEVEV